MLFDPLGVGIDFPVCTVGYTHGYSHSGPPGAGISKRHTLIQQQCTNAKGQIGKRTQAHTPKTGSKSLVWNHYRNWGTKSFCVALTSDIGASALLVAVGLGVV